LWDGPVVLKGWVNADGTMVMFSYPTELNLYICLDDPFGHTDVSDLNASYIVNRFAVRLSDTPSVESEIVQVDFKGDGNADMTSLYNSTGMVSSPVTITNAVSYSVISGVFSFTSTQPIIVSSDGNLMVIGESDPGNAEAIMFGIKK
jgi:hypothetical protein